MRGPIGNLMRGTARNVRPFDWLSLIEKVVLGLLALQIIRLLWVLVSPVGSFGPWEGRQAQFPSPGARQALFASFDPFFPRDVPQQAGNGVVTSLALTLYGIRLNEGSGLGSAIIASPDGEQNSFAVGDEVMPGVILKSVAFDHVTIDRGGAEEQIFLDQSQPAPIAAPEGGPPPAALPPGAPPPSSSGVTAEDVKRDIAFVPRMQNGRMTGLVVSSKGPAFATAGFHPGDIVTQINGQPIGSVGDLQTLQSQIAPGARLSLTVERGAAVASIALLLQGQ